ncbi:MAG: AAA family ATPase [Patescibacteria group bacterium]|nr:AAA family ATPase [Patescibacteria group bacterium]
MKRYCLIGIKGIGKSTLIKTILKEIPNIDYLIGSQILRELVGSRFDNFDYFPEDKKKKYREKAIEYMIKRQNENHKDILVDGHTSLYNLINNAPENVFTKLDCQFFTDLILYEVNALTVLERRKSDFKKKRILDLSIIKKELFFERDNSENIAKKNGMQMHYLNEDFQDHIGKVLIKILRGEKL